MSIWNKVLLGLIAVASLAFFYLSMRVLQTHDYWRKAYQQHVAALEKAQQEKPLLLYGDKDKPGIVQLKSKLHALRLIDQGGQVWANCTPREPDPQTGKVSVMFENAPGAAAPVKASLYVFEAANVKDGGRYLGEFRIMKAGDRQLDLQPVRQLSPRELERIGQSKGPWVVCTVLPLDSRGIFSQKTAEQLKELLPPDSVAEYLHDGKPAEPNDPPGSVVGGKFARPLRDYSLLLESAFDQRSILADANASAAQDNKYLEAALAEAGQANETLKADIAVAKKENQELGRQRDAVVAHLHRVEEETRDFQQLVGQKIAENQRAAAELARCQIEAAQHIEQRSSVMAGR